MPGFSGKNLKEKIMTSFSPNARQPKFVRQLLRMVFKFYENLGNRRKQGRTNGH